MASLQVDGVAKAPGREDARGSRVFSGPNPDGTRWRAREEDLIRHIESGDLRFYVRTGKESAFLRVATGAWGGKYLETEDDRVGLDRLAERP